jgi:hypothetical protein
MIHLLLILGVSWREPFSGQFVCDTIRRILPSVFSGSLWFIAFLLARSARQPDCAMMAR